jgi:hypothetical protein
MADLPLSTAATKFAFFPPSPLIWLALLSQPCRLQRAECRRDACLYSASTTIGLWPRILSGQRNRIQLQQRNCSGFTPDFSRRSTVQTRKEPISDEEQTQFASLHQAANAASVHCNTGLRFGTQDLFSQARFPRAPSLCQQPTEN